jgi:DNA mismatch repair protein MutS
MQVGSFYEAYSSPDCGYDLRPVQDIMNIALTKKNKKYPVSIKNPYMMGFPLVAKDKFVKILIDNGYTVIIIDQVTLPPDVKREVTNIYSAGTYLNENLTPDSNNIVSLYIEDEIQSNNKVLMCIGMSVIDLSTGENTVHESYSIMGDEKYALDEAIRFINSFNPTEILIHRKKSKKQCKGLMDKESLLLYLELESKNYYYYDRINKNYFKLSYQRQFLKKLFPDNGMLTVFEYLGMERMPYSIISYIALLDFAYEHNDNIINNIYKPIIFTDNKHLILGNNAIFQLNVLENKNMDSFNKKFKSLFDVVNNTSTAIGRRYLKNTLTAPLTNIQQLQFRYDSIEESINNDLYLKLEEHLKCIMDVERLVRKVSLKIIHPFEFRNLLDSYDEIIKLINVLKKTKIMKHILPDKKVIKQLHNFIKECYHTFNCDELAKYNLNDITGSFFNIGIYQEIDELELRRTDDIEFMKNICHVLSTYINDSKVPKKFRKKNSTSNDLKVYLNKNNRDGYFLSLTKIRTKSLKKNISKMVEIPITDNYNLNPKDLIYKEQGNNVKIFFDDLRLKSDNVSLLQEELMNIMKDTFIQLQDDYYNKYKVMFRKINEFVGLVDFIKSGAKTAKIYNYVKPNIYYNSHPVIE